MQIVYYYPGRPPSDPNMNNNNNNHNSGEETDHGNQIDEGTDEGLDEDTESYDSPDSIIDSNNDGTGLGTGTESDSNGLGSGTDSSTSDDNNTANEADIDTDEVSTDELQHGDQDQHQVLEGATGGVPMATTAETNVLAGGDLGTPGLSSITIGAPQNASGRISRLPARKKMSNTQILELLRPSQPTDGNATALTKCNADSCNATGITDCQGYCTEHFCNLYRQGNLDIRPRFEDEIQRGMLNLLLHKGRSACPRTRAFVEPPNPHDGVMGSAQGQDHGLHEGRSSSQGRYERHRRTSKVKCKSSMCNFAARETGYCGKCSRKKGLGAKPKEKYRCLANKCSNNSNSKYGLCRSCNNILEKENAKNVELTEPEIQRAACTYSSSSSDEISRGNEQRRNRRDRHTRRNEHNESPLMEGSYSHNRDIGVGARSRRSPALYSKEDQHTRQNSTRDYDEGRGSRYCEPHYESRAPAFNRTDMHYEMPRYDHTNEGRHTEYAQQNSARQRRRGENAQYEQRHIRECRRRESQYDASPTQQQRINMHCEMSRYDHTLGGRHEPSEEYSRHRNNAHRSNANSRYGNTEQRVYEREHHLYQQPRPEREDHERQRDNRQLNSRPEFIAVNDHTPPESIVDSPESSYYANGGWEMDPRPSQGFARHDINPRNPGGDREVASMQRNRSDSDSESGNSYFAPTYSESSKCRTPECYNNGKSCCHGYCNACYRQ